MTRRAHSRTPGDISVAELHSRSIQSCAVYIEQPLTDAACLMVLLIYDIMPWRRLQLFVFLSSVRHLNLGSAKQIKGLKFAKIISYCAASQCASHTDLNFNNLSLFTIFTRQGVIFICTLRHFLQIFVLVSETTYACFEWTETAAFPSNAFMLCQLQ